MSASSERIVKVRHLMAGIAASLALTALVSAVPASAQPNPMYLPYQEGAAYPVTTGANQGHHAASPYQRYDWDFGMPAGTPVLAAAPGVVQFAGNDGTGWGLSVSVKHPDGTTTIYAHLSAIAGGIGRDAQVGQAQHIGDVGSTGNSTGPHLHFGVHNGSGLSGYSVPSSFTEAGTPRTDDRPVSRNRPTDTRPQFAAKWVTQEGPSGALAPGTRGTLKFVFKNTGIATLYKGGTNPTNCRAANPRDRSSGWVDSDGPGAVGRQGVAIDQEKVDPGATFSCTIPLKAPARAGEYKEYFSPVVEGKAWLLERDDVWFPLTSSGS